MKEKSMTALAGAGGVVGAGVGASGLDGRRSSWPAAAATTRSTNLEHRALQPLILPVFFSFSSSPSSSLWLWSATTALPEHRGWRQLRRWCGGDDGGCRGHDGGCSCWRRLKVNKISTHAHTYSCSRFDHIAGDGRNRPAKLHRRQSPPLIITHACGRRGRRKEPRTSRANSNGDSSSRGRLHVILVLVILLLLLLVVVIVLPSYLDRARKTLIAAFSADVCSHRLLQNKSLTIARVDVI